MNHYSRFIAALTVFLALGLFVAQPAQAQFQYSTIDVPFGTNTELFDVNNAGTMAGSYLDSNGARNGFLLNNGAYTSYTVPGSSSTRFFSVNDKGQATGFYKDSAGQHGFQRDSNGTLTTIDYPGQDYNYAYRINNPGQISGYYFEFPNTPDGIHITSFLRQANGTFDTLLVSPTGEGTVLRGLNDAGIQTGWYFEDNGDIHGTIHNANGFTTYDAPGNYYTLINDINNRGDIVGNLLDKTTFESSAFLRTADGTLSIFDVPDGEDAVFQTINDNGLIVGAYTDANGNARGLVATTVPEPGSIALLVGMGVTGAGILARKQRRK